MNTTGHSSADSSVQSQKLLREKQRPRFSLKGVVQTVPGVLKMHRLLKAWRSGYSGFPFTHAFPAGHYYSPLPRLADILQREPQLFTPDRKQCPGVRLNESEQLNLLDDLARFYAQLPFPEHSDAQHRFYYRNGFFQHFDAIVLFAALCNFRPQRVVEVGSGFSSALMLDTNDLFLGGQTQFTFVEPYPEERLSKLLTSQDKTRHHILACPVQDVSLDHFDQLQSGDILFIDSSHVVKVGSDVERIVFELFPRLAKGVLIHVHDIFWPFEYPKEWYLMGRAWNEAYLLRAFLQFNTAFEILFFPSYLQQFHRDLLREKMPLCLQSDASSLWLKKVQ